MSNYRYIKPRHYKNTNTNTTTKEKGDNAMKNNDNLGTRFLAKGVEVSNDTHATLLNNNDCVIGATGCGKTTSYVYGNIAGMYGSYVIADTKGNLAKKFGPMLRKAGYDVQVMDFVDIERSAGYNPMDYIKRHFDGKYSEQDVQKLAELISPVKSIDDPYWETSAKNLICALIALVLEIEPHKNRIYRLLVDTLPLSVSCKPQNQELQFKTQCGSYTIPLSLHTTKIPIHSHGVSIQDSRIYSSRRRLGHVSLTSPAKHSRLLICVDLIKCLQLLTR